MLTSEHDILSDEEFQLISQLVYRHCGINLHEGKKELVRARLAKLMRQGGFEQVRDYLAAVEADTTGQSFTLLIDAISTNLTSFFRENRHFEYLSQTHLPALLARKSKLGHKRLRIWSAGCSSGEEPYTLGMVFSEALGAEAGEWNVKILASDISTRVLKIAESGVYDKARVESVPPALRAKYFAANRMEGKTVCQAGIALRRLITFRHLNLMENWPFTGPFEVIFCRNVMIYFDKPTQQKLVNRFHQVLQPGGLLFTGHSESLTGISHPFRYVQPTIYQKA